MNGRGFSPAKARRAVITGALGQDGYYLAALLRSEGTEVFGIERPSRLATDPDSDLFDGLYSLDLADAAATVDFISGYQPDEFYHLAAEHHSAEHGGNFDPAQNARMVRTNLVTTCVIADAIFASAPSCRLLVAGSSQMYTPTAPPLVVTELTPHRPASYYGLTKAMARDALSFYRSNLGLFCGTAILFNHESKRRAESFLSRKVSRAVARIAAGSKESLSVRNLNAQVDWCSAEDVVRGMRDMLRADAATDYVFGSGQVQSVRDLVSTAFACAGLNWTQHTIEAEAEPIPYSARSVVADPRKALDELDWAPRIPFAQMIADMVNHDLMTT